MQNAAIYRFAEDMQVSVHSVQLKSFGRGRWTLRTENNTGIGYATLSTTDRRQITKKNYQIPARQIGRSSDCDVALERVTEVD